MKWLRKALVIYLIASSVILHLVMAVLAYQVVPSIKLAMEVGREWGEAARGKPQDVGVIQDISTLKRGDHSYTGCAVEYQGQTLHVMAAGQEGLKVGDRVGVTVTKHPYAQLKTLMVLVNKKTP